MLRTWASLVILLPAGLTDEGRRSHATIMPERGAELAKNMAAIHPLQLSEPRVTLSELVA
jgi:hypothetical protein